MYMYKYSVFAHVQTLTLVLTGKNAEQEILKVQMLSQNTDRRQGGARKQVQILNRTPTGTTAEPEH